MRVKIHKHTFYDTKNPNLNLHHTFIICQDFFCLFVFSFLLHLHRCPHRPCCRHCHCPHCCQTKEENEGGSKKTRKKKMRKKNHTMSWHIFARWVPHQHRLLSVVYVGSYIKFLAVFINGILIEGKYVIWIQIWCKYVTRIQVCGFGVTEKSLG